MLGKMFGIHKNLHSEEYQNPGKKNYFRKNIFKDVKTSTYLSNILNCVTSLITTGIRIKSLEMFKPTTKNIEKFSILKICVRQSRNSDKRT